MCNCYPIANRLLAAVVLCSAPMAMAADELMNKLDAEAEVAKPSSQSVAGSLDELRSRKSSKYEEHMRQLRMVPDGLSEIEFKAFMMESWFETYTKFSELTTAKKTRVFEYYKQVGSIDISVIDDKIRELR